MGATDAGTTSSGDGRAAGARAGARLRAGATGGLVALAALARASHAGPTAMVTAMSAAVLVAASAPAVTVVVATAAVLTGQLSVGWSNDWVDARRDHAAGRVDKPVVVGALEVGTLRTAALGALSVCVLASVATGLLPGLVHVAAVASAWAYNLGLKATAWSWAPYAVSFALLPLFLVLTLPGAPLAPAWLVAGGGLLGVGAHVANVLPDLDDDARTGVDGAVHRLVRRRGRAAALLLAPAVLLAAVVVMVTGPLIAGGAVTPAPAALVVGGLAAVTAVVAGALGLVAPRSRHPFTLSMVVAALCVVLVVDAGRSVAGA
ncbi:UbiA family prenyltransferase [Cellulomonas sp. APG4]|uniref:UbiA family prenyltransferase n=1 Tax=Cellulomonas sp. APG4 TaxID=1538656 RepID=UPI00137B732C|nr:UbiA family prenyltransferase [Cellulomonas sp. APG4]NCT90935.1 UbiA family prenyltransferase [Cellulomonas sp. APG4]